MKKLYLFLFYLLSFTLCAQTVRFGYDDCGNRTTRFVENQKDFDFDFKSNIANSDTISGMEKTIQILPNPSAGLLNIELRNFEESDNCFLELYFVNGSLLEKWKMEKNKFQIDISLYADGLYFLKVVSNEIQYTEKIIKF